MPNVSSAVPTGRYRHFKGGEYEVLSVARHSETHEPLVVYRAIDDPERTWVRPLDMFTDDVERPEGKVPRFAPARVVGTAPRRSSAGGPLLARIAARARSSRWRLAVPPRLRAR